MTTFDSSTMLADPSQAGSIFGLDTASPVRQKHLFIVRFYSSVAKGDWQDGLSFICHNVERPSVQPTVEEVNQYNKKRLIHTGIKYTPINCTFYDTADGAAASMWAEYCKYYFGDFAQGSLGYTDDILNATLTDSSKTGFGYQYQKQSDPTTGGMDSQFFFDLVSITQVYGGEYVSTVLTNPKITSYNPDNLDYSASEVNMISLTLSYEGIYYPNDGIPQSLQSDTYSYNAFATGPFNGDVLAVDGAQRYNSFTGVPAIDSALSSIAGIANGVNNFVNGVNSLANNVASFVNVISDRTQSVPTTQYGGLLNKYGSYDFGSFPNAGFTTSSDGSTSQYLSSTLVQKNAAQVIGAFPTDGSGSADTANTLAAGIGIGQALAQNSIRDQYSTYSDGYALSSSTLAAINSQTDGTWQVAQTQIARPFANSLILNGDLTLINGKSIEL